MDGSDHTTVLVVEDDPNIVDLVRSNLMARGMDVVVSPTGADAVRLVESTSPELVLLDLMLPAIDGFELCRQIRRKSQVGLIVISARAGEHDKVRALNLGADDYMTKPFGIDELLARIGATLRRSRTVVAPPVETVLTFGGVTLDLSSQAVTRNGERVTLTPTEYALLRELAVNAGSLLSHATLLRRVWGSGYETSREYLRVYIGRLRAKLEAPGSDPLIVTEPRAGYRLLPD